MKFVRFLFACVCLTALIAATPPRPAPKVTAKPAPTPTVNRVVVSLRDGTSVAGEFVEATPAGVTIKPSPKSDPVMKPWSAIKQVSNGVTRASILAQWRTSQKELLCDTCNGEGATTCPTCDGKAVDPKSSTACTRCSGTGTTGACKTPHCVDGKIPCPMSCLKASDFTTPPDKADGKRKKYFHGPNGATAWWSDAHIGQLVVFEKGEWVNKGVCPRCGGKSLIDDPACSGTGKQPCATCKGKGVVGPPCPTCKDGKVVCATCGGTGLKPTAAPAAPAAADSQDAK